MPAPRQAWCRRSRENNILLQRQTEDWHPQAARRKLSKPSPTVANFLQQGLTSSSKATPLILLLPGPGLFKPPH